MTIETRNRKERPRGVAGQRVPSRGLPPPPSHHKVTCDIFINPMKIFDVEGTASANW